MSKDEEVQAGPGLLRELGTLTVSTYRVTRGFAPLLQALSHEQDVSREELADAIDKAFVALYKHPLLRSTEKLTLYLRRKKLIPNEQSTEDLIRFVVEQLTARSPVPVPQALVDEFWQFFNELFSSPELKGLGELSLDMVRLVLKTYEPLLVEIVNLLKAGRRFNQWQLQEILRRTAVVRHDMVILRRQIAALRYIKPFFQADPKDLKTQARIVAQMVREFGPFFIKMAQVAAANADFLPQEIARELAVFHEDVPPMTEAEVQQAFMECHGKPPHRLYLDFDASRPVKSGSIGSVYFAKKSFREGGREVLRPVIVKVGRQNIDREFAIGKLVLGLAIMSSQYWAPHSKLAPFLRAMQEQVDEFIAGFLEELDFGLEAKNHLRFHERSRKSQLWRVPELYGHSRRILEMEYLGDAASLTRALQRLPRAQRRRFQRQVSGDLLYVLLSHVLLHGEMHGDLHPGNVMVGADGRLNLIDWGNVVQVRGKWSLVGRYLSAALRADTGLLADSLIAASTQPAENAARRAAILQALEETLAKKKVAPLGLRNFIGELRRGGISGLRRRAQAAAQLMSRTQQTGVVLKRDYMHLSRALFAAAGSFGSLYENTPRKLLALDLGRGLVRLPLTATRDRLQLQLDGLRRSLARTLPLPGFLRSRLEGVGRVPALSA